MSGITTMTNDLSSNILLQLSRFKVKRFFEHQGFAVDDDYSFRMQIDGELSTVYIRHFGYVEVEGLCETWNLIDFLDMHFAQKRSTVINNVIKCLGLKKREGGQS